MLLQLAIENFKSIRERVVWSMLAVDGVEHRPGQTVTIPGIGEVLRIAGLYGPNASGKSTIAEAWAFFCDFAYAGRKPDAHIGRVPFKLDPAWRRRHTAFEAVITVEDEAWTYGIQVSDKRVEDEWLHRGQEVIFERKPGDNGRPVVAWGDGLSVSEARRGFLRFVAEGTRPNQPLLAELRERNADEFEPIYTSLSLSAARFTPIHPTGGPSLERIADGCARNKNTRQGLSRFLSDLDTGVVDLGFRTEDAHVQAALDRGEQVDEAELEHLRQEGRGIAMTFVHPAEGGGNVPLEAGELSDGTRRLVGLSLAWNAMAVVEMAAVIDELDRSFHPSLTRKLLHLLLDLEGPPRSQLLFTTHDTHLLDAGLLGADGIWFVEKDEHNATRLYSLAEFDPEHLAALTGALEEGYLQGRFGAIPFLGDPCSLGWPVPE